MMLSTIEVVMLVLLVAGFFVAGVNVGLVVALYKRWVK